MLPKHPAFNNDDDSITDITDLPAANLLIQPSAASVASPPPFPYYVPYHHYSPAAQFGDLYQTALELDRKEVMWLNKFISPTHAFIQIEAARTATVKLYLAVMHELEQRCKQAGVPLLKRVKALDEATREYAYTYQQGYRFISRAIAGHKVGAAVFLTIFQRCENAVREWYAYKRFDADVYFSESNDPERLFNQYFGDTVQAQLPALVQALPWPDAEVEKALNQADPARWQPYFEQLQAHLPANPTSFVAGVEALGQANNRNPTVATIYHEAVRHLSPLASQQPVREAILRLYLHYLYYGSRKYNFKPKPFLKRLQKNLFPQAEHLARFEALAQELLKDKRLEQAIGQVPAIYHQPRRKIELDPAAIHTARRQHAGTVELLNEYLQDDETTPHPISAIPKKTAKAVTLKAAPAAAPAHPVAPKVVSAPTSPAATFAPILLLSAPQQALLHLFAAHQLALPQNEVEAFARQHGTLRNQLIDGLNEACYDLLDDVLIEEAGDAYVIYAPYYQLLIG